MGRLRWEYAYEQVWSREAAARRLQRYVRGWLARTRVHRIRRRNARAEFEKARRRFKAAQLIQARLRGLLARKRVAARKAYVVLVATTIQRIWKGHAFRSTLWQEVEGRRATMIAAAMRGWLVRRRRFRLVAKVILLQQTWRHWRRSVPAERRQLKSESMKEARLAAQTIQTAYHDSKKANAF